mmetsp:Transcript_40283/g.72927  ORF Transcript_40283/g.72927 Transcript_40283/m.72927 type:complete len:362 (-) Transcript_40283:48-1133(-)
MESFTLVLALLQVLTFQVQAYPQSELATKCFADGTCGGMEETEALSLLQIKSQQKKEKSQGEVAAKCDAKTGYFLNATDTKCAYRHHDRLFREEGYDTDGCYQLCKQTKDCNYFSVALQGHFAGVCMGCTEGVTHKHKYFKFYSVCPGPAAECSVHGDPHISGFDQRAFSLLNLDGMGHGFVDVFGKGVYWLVKSDLISVQAMYDRVYYPSSRQPMNHTYMTALAVGGSFLKGHTLRIEPISGEVIWTGDKERRSILSSPTSDFKDAQNLVEASSHRSVVGQSSSDSDVHLHFTLPRGVQLHVDRFGKHLDMKVSMERSAAGPGEVLGQCGNFNGDGEDDQMEAILGLKVPKAENLLHAHL